MKKIYLTLTLVVFSCNLFCQQDIEMLVETVFIPDTAFLYALIDEGVDTNGDSLISYVEAESVDSLDISGGHPVNPNEGTGEIESLKGIEAFKNLYYLNCISNKLQSLDISKNPKLKILWVSFNKLTSLDVTNNIQLTDLVCAGNLISLLDLSQNRELIQLWCPSNLLTNIDIQNCLKLRALNCSGNRLGNLEISNNRSIDYLYLRDMETLSEVCVWTMPFPPDGFRVFGTEKSPNVYFTTECGSNNVSIPDTAFLYALIDEGVDTNGDSLISYDEAAVISYLNVGGGGWYEGQRDELFFCANASNISDLTGIEAFANLDSLDCKCSQITELDVSGNGNLKYLDCSHNQIVDLNVSGNIDLTSLDCRNNFLENLEITNNTALEILYCSRNPLSSLDFSKNLALKNLALNDMPSLGSVCFWAGSLPPEGIFISTTGSPNVYFTASCASHIKSIPGDYASIQEAIEAAADGDTLIVEEGTYYENINFLGKAITVASRFILDADTSHISKTIIDGSQSTNPDTASVVTMWSGEDTTSVLMGLTITGGTGTNYSWSRSDGSSVTDRAGGGIFILGSGGKILYNIIEGNHVEQTGGPESQYGGGFCGSLYHNHSLILRKNIVRSNGVKAERASGGGIFVDGGRILCEYNEIINNSAHASGMVLGGGFCGFYYEMEGTLKEAVIRNNLISGNSAITNSSYGGGGGLYQGSGYGLENIHVYNNIICKNHSSYIGGGAFFWDNTQGRIYNNTIVENTAENAEGRNVSVAYGVELAVYNNIIWSNENSSIPDIRLIETESARLKIFNNIIMNSLAQNNMVTAFNNWYEEPIFQSGSYALDIGSPGIGWGMDSQEIEGIWCNAPAFDFYGNPRPHSMDKYADLGAIESAFEKTLIIGERERLTHSGLSFYPNPTTGLLTIQNFDNDKCNFEIISLNGHVVFSGKMHGPSVQIDLSSFQKGVYFITVRSEDFVTTRKIIKLLSP